MSKRRCPVRRSTASSSAVSRSISKVARCAALSIRATWYCAGYVGCCRCREQTAQSRAHPPAASESPSSVTRPAATRTRRSSTNVLAVVIIARPYTAKGKVSGTSPASHSAVAPEVRPPASRRSGARRRTGRAGARGNSGSCARSPGGRSRRWPAPAGARAGRPRIVVLARR